MGTPLIACMRHRTLPHMWQLLLDHGADPGKGDADLSPVQHAILMGKLDLLWGLKAAGADINAVDTSGRGSPLRFAIAMRCVDAALELIEMGADVNASLHNQSMLHFLCLPPAFDRETELIRALVLKGANVNSRDSSGRTPLLCAVHEGRAAIAAALCDLGANIGATDDRGANAMLILVKSALAVTNIELADMLLTKGASATLPPTRGTWSAAGWIEKMLVCAVCLGECCLARRIFAYFMTRSVHAHYNPTLFSLQRDRIGDTSPYQELATLFFRHGISIDIGGGDI
jgi:ankyrin repeat protein